MSDQQRYIHIRNWDRFQHYSKRNPPWIKNYTELLSDEAYLRLSDHRRAVLHGLWLAYAKSRRSLPEDTAYLSRTLHLRVMRSDLEALSGAGFLAIGASAPIADGKQDATPETETETEKKPLAATPRKDNVVNIKKSARVRDELWDELVKVIGITPSTKSERGRWNAALKELREAGATADEVHARAKAYRRRWPEVSLTPTALSANWGSLQTKSSSVKPCPTCGLGGGHHANDCPTVSPFTDADVENVFAQIGEHRASTG